MNQICRDVCHCPGGGKLYFVLVDYGALGRAYAERSPADCTWQTTVRDIADRQWDNVRQVLEVDPAAGTSADVTEKALLAARLVNEGVPVA